MLRIAIARSVVPDELLEQIQIADVYAYREEADDAYRAWSVEIDRLASEIAPLEPTTVEAELPRIIHSEVRPKLIEYESGMPSVRDQLFSELLKKISTWELPTLSLSFLAGIDPASVLTLFAAGLTPSIPSVVD